MSPSTRALLTGIGCKCSTRVIVSPKNPPPQTSRPIHSAKSDNGLNWLCLSPTSFPLAAHGVFLGHSLLPFGWLVITSFAFFDTLSGPITSEQGCCLEHLSASAGSGVRTNYPWTTICRCEPADVLGWLFPRVCLPPVDTGIVPIASILREFLQSICSVTRHWHLPVLTKKRHRKSAV